MMECLNNRDTLESGNIYYPGHVGILKYLMMECLLITVTRWNLVISIITMIQNQEQTLHSLITESNKQEKLCNTVHKNYTTLQ